MGYHVSIVNTSNIPREEKILTSECRVSQHLKKFNFQPKYSNDGSLDFYFRDTDEIILFYNDESLWLSNPTEKSLQLLIDVANYFSDGSRVRGDDNETYISISEFYYHQDDNVLQNDYFPKANRLYWRGWLIPVVVGVMLLILRITLG